MFGLLLHNRQGKVSKRAGLFAKKQDKNCFAYNFFLQAAPPIKTLQAAFKVTDEVAAQGCQPPGGTWVSPVLIEDITLEKMVDLESGLSDIAPS